MDTLLLNEITSLNLGKTMEKRHRQPERYMSFVLVTQEESNIPIYEKYGFTVAVEKHIDTGM
jgi:hypothetical protein